MSTRMILCIAFVFFVVLGMIVYIVNDNSRASTTTSNVTQEEAQTGAELFGANCSQCHGPRGEGAIGPAVNRSEWHFGDPKYDENSVTAFIHNVLQRGQYSPQPGINMPAWSREYGGPFNDQQIEQLVAFLTHPNWDEPLRHTATPNYLADIPPNSLQKQKYPALTVDVLKAQSPDKYGTQSPTAAQQKQLENDAKAEDGSKGAAFQTAMKNAEVLRVELGNREPTKPTEALNGVKQLLQIKGCINCHGFGSAGTTLGPNLTEVGSRRSADWLYEWIKNPSAVAASNRGPNIQPWFKGDNRAEFWPMMPTFMPTITMTDDERHRIVDYISNLKGATVATPKTDQTTPKS